MMMKRLNTLLVGPIVISGLLLAACGDEGGTGPDADARPTLSLTDSAGVVTEQTPIRISTAFDQEVGDLAWVKSLVIRNTGTNVLEVTAIEVTSNPPGAFTVARRPPTDAAPMGEPFAGFPVMIDPQGESGDNLESLPFGIVHTRQPSGTIATATITIRSDSIFNAVAQPALTYDVVVEAATARLQVVPEQVDFGSVSNGEPAQQVVSLLNQGNEDLVITDFVLRGNPAFSVVIGEIVSQTSVDTAQGIELVPSLIVESGKIQTLTVLFLPASSDPAEGELILFDSDGAQTLIPIQGNVGGPCIALNPRNIDFGGKVPGNTQTVSVDVTSCGDTALSISEIFLSEDSDGEFTVSLSGLPGVSDAGPVGALGPADAPVVLAPNQVATFNISYSPLELSPLGADDRPIPDFGSLTIRSNSFNAETLMDLTGVGVPFECPTSVIVVQEGEEVIPQTRLHLVGSQSYSSTVGDLAYQWEVQQPVGSQSVFKTSADIADPTFEVNVAGRYVFRLTVTDAGGEESCFPAEATVVVNPDEAIHIELVWDTPNDPDQTDEGPRAGADLDMHFAHPFAITQYDGDGDDEGDPWFDFKYDVFFNNKEPNWGASDPFIEDNPSQDRDDTDGAGPENINLNIPEDGSLYRVGVHYWDDKSFGLSYATLRIFIFGTLVFDRRGVEMIQRDFWWAATIAWPSRVVAPILVCDGTIDPCETDADCGGATCSDKVTPQYNNPFATLE